jgi:hypothetical protein
MSLDLNIPVVIGGASALIGYGLAYLLYKKYISNKYGKGKENANSAYYWCGLIAMIAVGQGLGTLINEGFLFLTSKSSINGDAVARGLVTLIFYPFVLFLVGIFAGKFIIKNPQHSSSVKDENRDSLSTNTNANASSIPNQKIIIAILGFVIVLLVAYNFLPKNILNSNEKTFEMKSCKSCSHGDCKSVEGFKGFKVTRDQVFLFIKTPDGQDRISIYPNEPKMKCAILPERNFAFDCNSIDTESGLFSQSSLTFNGNDKFVNTWVQRLIGSNAPGININWQCEVN